MTLLNQIPAHSSKMSDTGADLTAIPRQDGGLSVRVRAYGARGGTREIQVRLDDAERRMLVDVAGSPEPTDDVLAAARRVTDYVRARVRTEIAEPTIHGVVISGGKTVRLNVADLQLLIEHAERAEVEFG